jgi:hypothetical protein
VEQVELHTAALADAHQAALRPTHAGNSQNGNVSVGTMQQQESCSNAHMTAVAKLTYVAFLPEHSSFLQAALLFASITLHPALPTAAAAPAACTLPLLLAPVQRPVCCQASRILAAITVAQHDLLVVVMHGAQVRAVPAVVEEPGHYIPAGVKVVKRLKQWHYAQAVGVVGHLARLCSNLQQRQPSNGSSSGTVSAYACA